MPCKHRLFFPNIESYEIKFSLHGVIKEPSDRLRLSESCSIKKGVKIILIIFVESVKNSIVF